MLFRAPRRRYPRPRRPPRVPSLARGLLVVWTAAYLHGRISSCSSTAVGVYAQLSHGVRCACRVPGRCVLIGHAWLCGRTFTHFRFFPCGRCCFSRREVRGRFFGDPTATRARGARTAHRLHSPLFLIAFQHLRETKMSNDPTQLPQPRVEAFYFTYYVMSLRRVWGLRRTYYVK